MPETRDTRDRPSWTPAESQPELPLSRLISEELPRRDVDLDVVFVGGGPAGLAGAIALARRVREAPSGSELSRLEIGVIEKSSELGEHCLSGAVIDPVILRSLFPGSVDGDLPLRTPVERERVYWLGRRTRIRLPVPPPMHNRGNHVASVAELVRWMGHQAEQLGVHVLTGFPADKLLVSGRRVLGVRTAPAGLDRDGNRGPAYLPPSDIAARVTVLAEGNRGPLTQAWFELQELRAEQPQFHALGVKELWRTEAPPREVIHTLGWPLPPDVFGGSFVYPLGEGLLAIGLVAGLDHGDAGFDVHERLQDLKSHPALRRYLAGGELLEWGAKTIPEGGYYSVPRRLAGEGAIVVGDGAGLVDVPSLKGIHYAMESARLAALSIAREIETKSAAHLSLSSYDEALRASFVWRDLWRSRNVRRAFKHGFWRGSALASLILMTGGRLPRGPISMPRDADVPRRGFSRTSELRTDGAPRLSKPDAVYRSGNATRDDVPSHLLLPERVSEDVARFYAHMCPAGVYEWVDGRFVVNPSNCIDCKTTDILGPRWLPREGGSGPRYRRM